MLNSKEIVGIFDIDMCSIEKRLRDYLAHVQRAHGIVDTAEDLPQSFIVTKDKVYVSGLSTGILKNRIEQVG